MHLDAAFALERSTALTLENNTLATIGQLNEYLTRNTLERLLTSWTSLLSPQQNALRTFVAMLPNMHLNTSTLADVERIRRLFDPVRVSFGVDFFPSFGVFGANTIICATCAAPFSFYPGSHVNRITTGAGKHAYFIVYSGDFASDPTAAAIINISRAPPPGNLSSVVVYTNQSTAPPDGVYVATPGGECFLGDSAAQFCFEPLRGNMFAWVPVEALQQPDIVPFLTVITLSSSELFLGMNSLLHRPGESSPYMMASVQMPFSTLPGYLRDARVYNESEAFIYESATGLLVASSSAASVSPLGERVPLVNASSPVVAALGAAIEARWGFGSGANVPRDGTLVDVTIQGAAYTLICGRLQPAIDYGRSYLVVCSATPLAVVVGAVLQLQSDLSMRAEVERGLLRAQAPIRRLDPPAPHRSHGVALRPRTGAIRLHGGW